MDTGALPEIVRHPNGLTEPFQPERITRSLFKSSESIGNNNPFLSQELTDGILHFLALEGEGRETTPGQIGEVVVKVVRELGFPDLARSFENRNSLSLPVESTTQPVLPAWLTSKTTPQELRDQAAALWLTQYSLEKIYPRELVCAHQEGLIRLGGLDAPFEMEGIVLTGCSNLEEQIVQARRIAGGFIAMDGPEYDLSRQEGDAKAIASSFWRTLQNTYERTGLVAVVNLNSNTPPLSHQMADGPLFGRDNEAESLERRHQLLKELIENLDPGPFRLYWHLSEAVEKDPLTLQLLQKVVREIVPVEFVFDRSQDEVVLGPGLDRSVPGVLQEVGINLVRLLEQMESPIDPALFLKKVSSLARFAKTAGHVKQDYLRQQGRKEIRDAFLLERSRIVLIPEGLEVVAGATSLAPVEFGRQIIQTLRHAVEGDRPRIMPIQIDSPLNSWGCIAPPREILSAKGWKRGVSSWHEAAGGGAVSVRLENDSLTDLVALLTGFMAGSTCRARLFAEKSSNWRLQ